MTHVGRVEDFARVHDSVGVEELLDISELANEFGSEHLLCPCAANDAVAVFAAEGASEL